MPDKKTLIDWPCCANCYQWTGRKSFWRRLLGFRTLTDGKCLSDVSNQFGKTVFWSHGCGWHIPDRPLPVKNIACKGCGTLYHPSWNGEGEPKICPDCSGAT